MEVTLLGTGTSQGIPVIGCQCNVCTSTDSRNSRLRNAALIEHSGLNILIDCGPDFRQQALRAGIKDLDAIFITHEHNDHIIGLDDIRPILFKRKTLVPIFCLARVADSIRERFAYAFGEYSYPGAPKFEIIEVDAFTPIILNDHTEIMPIAVMHGELPILGFRIDNFAYLTDVKSLSEKSIEHLQDLDVIVMSALHLRPHHSHLNLDEAVALAQKINAKQTYLTHLSHYMGLHEEISEQLGAKIDLGYDSLKISP